MDSKNIFSKSFSYFIGMGLFSQPSIKRSVGTRPNTPVFDNAEDEGNVEDQYEDEEDDNNEDYDNYNEDGEDDDDRDDDDYGYEEDESKITRTISSFQCGQSESLFSAPKSQTSQGISFKKVQNFFLQSYIFHISY